MHQRNIVHRDLKLGNLVLHRVSRRITLINFCLGKHLTNEEDLLRDQRGSPAYISPDVLSGKPYLGIHIKHAFYCCQSCSFLLFHFLFTGKPSDLWALGVVLFTMLYGQFPFYDSVPQELFRKIKAAEFTIPRWKVWHIINGIFFSISLITCRDGRVSESTIRLVRLLLHLNPLQRLKADQVVDLLDSIIATSTLPSVPSSDRSNLQVSLFLKISLPHVVYLFQTVELNVSYCVLRSFQMSTMKFQQKKRKMQRNRGLSNRSLNGLYVLFWYKKGYLNHFNNESWNFGF